jgi:hypothetical protein
MVDLLLYNDLFCDDPPLHNAGGPPKAAWSPRTDSSAPSATNSPPKAMAARYARKACDIFINALREGAHRWLRDAGLSRPV